MNATPEVVLTMPARLEGVGVVRQALAGMADALDVDASVLADMRMAVTEACTNVVVHAYDEDAGVLEVEMLAGIGVPAAATGLVYPIWAMLAMVASVTTVFLNSLRGNLPLLFSTIASVGRRQPLGEPTAAGARP